MLKNLIVILLLVLSPCLYGQNIIEKANLIAGKYHVGFQLKEYKDYSRTAILNSKDVTLLAEEQARTIRMYMWYPAKSNQQEPNTVKDFFTKQVEDFGKLDQNKLEEIIYYAPQFNRIPKSKVDKLLMQECASVDNVSFAEGKFPVIILGQGYYYESPISHLVLCEYLASHGYIVMTCPLFGTNSKAVELNMIDFETQIRDLEFLMSKANELQNADLNSIAALGFDLGAMSATLVQMRNSNIKALITYDGGIMFEHNTTQLLNPSPYYQPEKLDVPTMIFTRTIEGNIQMGLKEDSTIFHHSPYAKKYLVRTEGMKHNYYTSLPVLGIESRPSPELAIKAYPIICSYTLNFFDFYLKNNEKGLQFIKDDPTRFNEDGVHISVEEIEAKEKPINLSMLEYAILNGEVDDGISLYHKARSKNQIISEEKLNSLAYLFLYNYGRPHDAISIFKLIISEYPQSANAYDSLGEAYLYTKDYTKAKENYQKSLDLNPKNANAKRIINQLSKLNI